MNTIYHYDDRHVGFGSSVTVAFSTIKHCVKNNTTCHVNIKNKMYGSEEQNLWDLFLNQPFDINTTTADISTTTNPFKIGCWEYPTMDIALKKLRDEEHILEYQKLYKEFFILKDDFRESIEKFLINYKNKKILGLHRRGRDQLTSGHGKQQKFKLDINYLFSVVDQEIENYDYLYLTSDEHDIYQSFCDKYGKKVIVFDSKEGISNYDRGLHEIFINANASLKNTMLQTMLFEMIILSRCDRLLLVNSNLSQIALYLSNHLNYKFYDEHVQYSGILGY